PSGKVLVAGGQDTNSTDTLVAELYDPSTGTWTITGPVAREHEQHSAILLSNGNVLIAGGFLGQFGGSDVGELYDPGTRAWSWTNSSLRRYAYTATLLPNGKVLAAGGTVGISGVTNHQDLYDVGLGFSASWQPQIAGFPAQLSPGGGFALSGS